MFIPWFDVENAVGDITWIAALSVTVINDDRRKDLREIVAGSQVIKTRLPAAEIFERMGSAIEGARDAEIKAAQGPTFPEWDSPRSGESRGPNLRLEPYPEGTVSPGPAEGGATLGEGRGAPDLG